jgi:hypothetical protein
MMPNLLGIFVSLMFKFDWQATFWEGF